ncbi:hypothetical protein [Streptomyces sp. C8S0]|uniref:hypothetical protein n=1 Tax=Streptomyces sp. C8S0 TaxID=2585716 RepID=UPI001D03CB4C|nr:hypothetical protein [Streptomyces sp. C8S0]
MAASALIGNRVRLAGYAAIVDSVLSADGHARHFHVPPTRAVVKAVMGVRTKQVEQRQRRAFGIPTLHGAVHGDDGDHLKMPVALVRMVKSTEGPGA